MIVRDALAQVAEEVIEAHAVGLARTAGPAKAPLADRRRPIARGLQRRPDRDRAGLERALPLEAEVVPHVAAEAHLVVVADVGVAGVLARQQRTPRGRTHGTAGIVRGEAHALGGEPVDVRRADLLLPVAAHLTHAEVIGQDVDDVRLAAAGGGLPQRQRERRRPQARGLDEFATADCCAVRHSEPEYTQDHGPRLLPRGAACGLRATTALATMARESPKMSKLRIVCASVAVLLSAGLGAQALWQGPNDAARAAAAQAAAIQKSDPERAAALFRQAIEAAPDFFPAHEGYVTAMKAWRMGPEPPVPPPTGPVPKNSKGVPIVFPPKTRAIPLGGGPASAELTATYGQWAAQYPAKAVMQWGLGYVQLNTDRVASESAFKRALAIDPRFSPAYSGLALLALLGRDSAARAAYLKQAAAADPNDPQAAVDVIEALPEPDRAPALWAVVNRFPGTDTAYRALIGLVNPAATPAEKLPAFRRMWEMFPDNRSFSHCWTMKQFFGLTTGDDPATAWRSRGRWTKDASATPTGPTS